jgi:hypothetical protein
VAAAPTALVIQADLAAGDGMVRRLALIAARPHLSQRHENAYVGQFTDIAVFDANLKCQKG